ncbi:hypothetical protein [Bacillus coahuilensis]|uniref:hypothetical protein n=1 Tax=Bacillus coahuilensis TaxID=408580 RepID=UPI0001850F1F|nr:hypothetical protein [Bacillus coahuilensis]
MIESKLKSEKELLETFVSLSKYFNVVKDESRLEKVKLLSKKIAKQHTIFGILRSLFSR